MKRWKKLPALPGRLNPCANCPPIEPVLDMRSRIAVGFGYAALTCDGKTVWQEGPGDDWRDCWTVRRAEQLAEKKPRHDWRIVLHGPLRGETYQRHGKGNWVLVEKNEGFA